MNGWEIVDMEIIEGRIVNEYKVRFRLRHSENRYCPIFLVIAVDSERDKAVLCYWEEDRPDSWVATQTHAPAEVDLDTLKTLALLTKPDT